MSEPSRTNSPIEAKTEEPDEKKAALPALKPEDFYYENGLLVFTAAYHLKRGYCCNSGCRHCPYG